MAELKNNVLDMNNNKLQYVIVEYVFIDSNNNLRSKTRIIHPTWINTTEKNKENSEKVESVEKAKEDLKPIFNIDIWMVDGSIIDEDTFNENKHLENNETELFLVPRCLFNDPFNNSTEICKYLLCMCEIFNHDGKPYLINNRYKLYEIINTIGENKIKEDEPLFSMQQEYLIADSTLNSKSLYHTNNDNNYNCCVGYGLNYNRIIAMEHMNYCLKAGIKLNEIKSISGFNKWSYRIDFYSPFEICDNLWITRYILKRIGELHGVSIHFNIKLNVSSSFFYINFSNKKMRGDNGIHTIIKTIENLKLLQNDIHSNNNGDNQSDNNSNIDNDYKIPMDIKLLGKGHFEYKTNGYNIDPYLKCAQLIKAIFSC